ncbi:MAG: HXXEE domain-containing protein, partial [Lachnospirales bacterium]
MNFIRNNWYRMGLIFFIIMSFYMIFLGNDSFSNIQKILCASLMALPIHQFEEYAIPGGGPIVINRVYYGEDKLYNNYPGNWNSIMIVNLSAYVFYILALLFPKTIWLGTATMMFNLFQLIGHAFQMNIKMKTWYNPGLASVIFLFTPISIYYFYFVISNNIIGGFDWFFAVLMLLLIIIITIILPVQLMKDKNSKYIIPSWQNEQF